MNATLTTPSLTGDSYGASQTESQVTHKAKSLLPEKSVKPKSLFDLMYDGFYALFMLKNGSTPQSEAEFTKSIMRFLDSFEHSAKKLALSADDIHDAKYAFCATVDETILTSDSSIRSLWERKPLQLVLFGDQLAGEHFFDKLEGLRAQGASRVQALEIFHMCLLLGFQGKYMLDASEKLHYLTARLGDEIAGHKGKAKGFAPRWERPDQVSHRLKHEVPLWVIGCVFALIGTISYTLFNRALNTQITSTLSAYNEVVQMAPHTANLTIILP